jgi:hypothetical protein
MRHFLLGQARQEATHALLFHGVSAWLTPRHAGVCPILPALTRYRELVAHALRQRHLLGTLVAEQIILEGLGEAILKRIEEGLVRR